MAVYEVWVEIKVETVDEPGDMFVDLPEADYKRLGRWRDPEAAKTAALVCAAAVEQMKQPKRNAARERHQQ